MEFVKMGIQRDIFELLLGVGNGVCFPLIQIGSSCSPCSIVHLLHIAGSLDVMQSWRAYFNLGDRG